MDPFQLPHVVALVAGLFMAKAHSVSIVNGAWADGSSGNKLSFGLSAAAIRPIVIAQANREGWSPFQKISLAQEYRP
jgi:hypothetical protein